MISVRTNLSSLIANRHIGLAARAVNFSLNRLSSGKRINSAADDPAGLALSMRLKAQIEGMSQAKANVDNGISLIQTAEGGVFEITSILHRLNSLAIEAANGTLTSTDRDLIQNEVDQLILEIDRLASATTFNNVQLLKGSTIVGTGSIQIQAGYDASSGISINLSTMTTTALGIDGLNVAGADTSAAEAALDSITSALGEVASLSSKIGGLHNRLYYASDFLDVQRINSTSALSAIQDTDFATELTEYTQQTLLTQSATSVMAQSNVLMQKVISILGIQ